VTTRGRFVRDWIAPDAIAISRVRELLRLDLQCSSGDKARPAYGSEVRGVLWDFDIWTMRRTVSRESIVSGSPRRHGEKKIEAELSEPVEPDYLLFGSRRAGQPIRRADGKGARGVEPGVRNGGIHRMRFAWKKWQEMQCSGGKAAEMLDLQPTT